MQSNWYLRGKTETEGPFSEPEIRARLLAGAYPPGAEVKQGNSAWRNADEVKQLFVRVYQEGWYVKNQEKTVGPFVTQKILDLHRTGKLPKRAMVRQGSSTTWIPVGEMIESQQQKQALLAQLSETLVVPPPSKEAPRQADEDDVEVIEDLMPEDIEDGLPATKPQAKQSPPTQTRLPSNHSKPIVTVTPISTVDVPIVKPMSTANVPIVKPISVVPTITVQSPKGNRSSTFRVDDVPVVQPMTPVAEVVLPTPVLSMSSQDAFRDVAAMTPSPVMVVPSYSQPIAPSYLQGSRKPTARQSLQSHEQTIWTLFRWLIGLAVVPRIVEVLLALLTYLTSHPLPIGIAYSIVGAEVSACFAITMAISIWVVVIAFQESIEQGLLYIFIPFYSFYYIVSRWDRCWGAVLLVSGAMLWALSIAAFPIITIMVLMI